MAGNGDFQVTCRICNKPLKLGIDTAETKMVKPFTRPATQNRSRTHQAILPPLLLTTKFLASICCDQSAVAMRFGTRLPSAKLTLFSRLSATGGATNREYLFWTEFFWWGNKPRVPVLD